MKSRTQSVEGVSNCSSQVVEKKHNQYLQEVSIAKLVRRYTVELE